MTARPGERLLVAHALAATAMALPWPALLVAVFARTGSDAWVGATGALRLLPYVLLSALAGALADRLPRVRVIRASTALRAGLLGGCAIALAAGVTGPAVVLAVLAVAAGTPAYPAAVAAVPGLTGRRTGPLTDLLVTAEVTAFVVGPAVGGLLLGAGQGRWTAGLAALMTVLSLALLTGLDTPRPVQDDGDGSRRGRLRTVLAAPGAGVAVALVALVNVAESAAAVAFLALSHERWGDGDQGFGLATAAFGFGSLGAPLLGLLVRLRGSLVLAGGGLAAAGVLPGVGAAVAPLVLAGAAGTVVECAGTAVLQDAVPDRVRAFALGLTDAVMVLAAMVGSLVVPVLVAAAGPASAFVLLAVLLAVGAVVVRPRRERVAEVAVAVGGRVGR